MLLILTVELKMTLLSALERSGKQVSVSLRPSWSSEHIVASQSRLDSESLSSEKWGCK